MWAGSGCGGYDSSEIWSTNTHGSSGQHEAHCSAITLEPSITLKTVWLFWLSWPTYGLNRECFWHSAFSWSLINNNNPGLSFTLHSYIIQNQTNVIKTDQNLIIDICRKNWDVCMSTIKLGVCIITWVIYNFKGSICENDVHNHYCTLVMHV